MDVTRGISPIKPHQLWKKIPAPRTAMPTIPRNIRSPLPMLQDILSSLSNQTRMAAGSSNISFNVWRKPAPVAPSITR